MWLKRIVLTKRKDYLRTDLLYLKGLLTPQYNIYYHLTYHYHVYSDYVEVFTGVT